jgi:hypothetical protein
MSRREYMADAAATWLGMGTSLQKLSEMRECFGKTAKSDMGGESSDRESDLDPVFDGIAGMADCCLKMARKCVQYAKAEEADELRKAQGMDGDGIRPDQVSSIVGEIPNNVRPIFRAGQKDFSKVGDTVDANLQKIIGVTEDS